MKMKISTKWTLKGWNLHGIIISPRWHVKKSREVYGKNWTNFVYKLGNLFRSIRVTDKNSSVTRALHFFKLLWTPDFFAFRMHHSKRRHKFSTLSNIICYFQSFTNFLRELNDREIENHYKMNSENVGTWHGIIISPAEHAKKSREGYGRNWTHFMYKLGNLFRSIRVSDDNSFVTRAIHFF